MNKLNRIGILGGTFNPIHIGHLKMAEEACNVHNLLKVLFIPTNIPPHKHLDGLTDARHRYQMVKAAIRENNKFEVSDIEIKREGKSYTIDTVQHIIHSYQPETSNLYNGKSGNNCEIFLILGADSLNELELWKDIKKLSQLCHIVAVNRPGYASNTPSNLFNAIGHDSISDLEKSKVHISPVEVSSSGIRKRLNEGLDISGLVPSGVEDYIREHGLYLSE